MVWSFDMARPVKQVEKSELVGLFDMIGLFESVGSFDMFGPF